MLTSSRRSSDVLIVFPDTRRPRPGGRIPRLVKRAIRDETGSPLPLFKQEAVPVSLHLLTPITLWPAA
jgi:hypothetical protein